MLPFAADYFIDDDACRFCDSLLYFFAACYEATPLIFAAAMLTPCLATAYAPFSATPLIFLLRHDC